MNKNPGMYQKKTIKNPCTYLIKEEKKLVQSLSFDPAKDYETQRAALEKKFLELIKMPEKKTKPVAIIEYEDTSNPLYDEIRFVIETEPDFYVPAHLVTPKGALKKLPEGSKGLPLVICLQGHNDGMHLSLAKEAYPGREYKEAGKDREFALQAISHGYAAIAMEQRGFGELALPGAPIAKTCHMIAWQCALMGTTMLGRRLLDVSCLLDVVESEFDFIDRNKIGIMGNSGGGTSSFYAACIDKRIKITMPSCSFCTIIDSWGSSHHCDCAYIPDMLNYMEMQDLTALIAPRPMIAVAGLYDDIQPIEGVRIAFDKAKEIYAAAGAADNAQLVVGPEGHRFYADLAWPVFAKYMDNL